MAIEFFHLRLRPWGLMGALGFLATCATLASFFGAHAWWLEILSHFRAHYVLFFLLLAGLYALGRKHRWTAAALALAGVNALPIALFLLPPATTPPANGPVLRAMLMNVNTRRGDPALVRAAILRENPDLLVLDEISAEWVKSLEPVLAAYPFRLTEPRPDNFGIGLFSRLPLEAARVEHSGMAELPSLFAEIQFDGRPLALVATHPLPPANADLAAERNAQLDWIARQAAALPHPVLLLGDLNTSPWSPYYRRLIKTSGLADSAKGRSIHPTWPSFLPALWIPLDHALHSEEIAIHARRIGPTVGSDHFPLVVDFGWAARPGQ